MKRLFIFVVLLPMAFSCDDSDNTRCIAGEVILYDGCQGVSLIEVDGQFDIGDSLEINNRNLVNTIQVPGRLEMGRGFFSIRNYESNDAYFDPGVICLAIYIPYDVPLYTIIIRSNSACP